MEKKDVMLSAWKFDESHTENSFAVSCSPASNMVAAMNSANLKSLPCLAHSLQLIIKDGVLMQPAVQ